jgi:protein-L-isoaspartate(D-aspartate) O-methyltransferase
VLEVGTGLGYQTAVLGQLVRRVWSVEVIEELAVEAAARLRRLGYDINVGIHIGDGSLGWAEHAPYDKIIVTAAAKRVPALLQQLKPGGLMVLPIALAEDQKLTVVAKDVAGQTMSER